MEYFTLEQCKSVLNSIFSMWWVKLLFSVVGMAVAWLFDDTRGILPIYIVATLIVLDSVSGIIAALKNEGLSSKKSKRILLKFVLYGIGIITGRLVDKLLNLGHPVFAVIIETALGLTEGQSIIENLGRAGMPIPEKLKKLFEQFKK